MASADEMDPSAEQTSASADEVSASAEQTSVSADEVSATQHRLNTKTPPRRGFVGAAGRSKAN